MRTALLVCLLAVSASFAQTAPPLQAFRAEFPVDPRDLSIPDMPIDIAEQVMEGALEIRQQVAYDAPAGQLNVRTFAVPTAAPPVTSMVHIQNMQLEKFHVEVVQVRAADQRIYFSGVVKEGARGVLSGAAGGRIYTITAHFTGSDPAMFFTLSSTLDGAVVYSHEGSGLVQIGGARNNAPRVIVTPDYFESYSPEVRFDASATFDPDGDELDFKWRVPTGAAALRGCETPVATIQLSQGAGIYEAEVLVTDSKGATATAMVRVNYLGR